MKKSHSQTIIDKSKNNAPIRVLYKKSGQPPETKILDNVFKLKKAIVKKKLDIIPYEKLYIVCNNRKYVHSKNPNIILTFNSIYGDLILVDIDKNVREFKGLSQEDVIWYSQKLMNQAFNGASAISTPKRNERDFTRDYEYDLDRESGSKPININFEKALISVLVNIEMTLANLLREENKK